MKANYLSILLFLSVLWSFAQTTTIEGVVTDANTQEPLPFVNFLVEQEIGGMTDIEGKYQITIPSNVTSDSITFSSFGYYSQVKKFVKGNTQVIDVVLENQDVILDEVVIEMPENPSYIVIRNAVANKKKNDIRSLEAYQYESYNRIELSMNNLSEQFKGKKALKKLNNEVEALQKRLTDSTDASLPVFISETISDFYFRTSPESKKEIIKATKITGVGVEDGSVTSQFLGPSFQQFNFYQNSISILNKEFISPLTIAWKLNYRYIIDDTVMIGDRECYEIEIIPRREQDLAFRGNIWITTDSLSTLKKVDLRIHKDANINFIDEIHIIQEWEQTEVGPWYVSKTDITVDIEEISKSWAGMIVNSTSSYKDMVVNKEKPTKFYEYQTEVLEDAQNQGDEYWLQNRHDSLSVEEQESMALVDSLKNLPTVRSYVDIAYFLADGYRTVGKSKKIAFGPYLQVYAYNNLEKHRFRLGFRTNEYTSQVFYTRGYLAYGTGDKQWKYNLQGRCILDKRPWTEIGFKTRKDIDILGLEGIQGGALFTTFLRWGNVVGGYMNTSNSLYIKRQVTRHLQNKITLHNRFFNPLFDFAYYDKQGERKETITSSEIVLEAHYGKNEVFLQNGAIRKSLGGQKGPAVDISYTLGISDVLGGDYTYHKVGLSLNQKIGLGSLGRMQYWLRGGKAFTTLPYPLLTVHLGNETFFYTNTAFSLMNYFEFVSDQYASFVYEHHFDGFFFNRIPLLQKLKWRTVTNVNVIYGDINQENIALIPNDVTNFTTFEGTPYVEVGYGIENIFRILRIQAFHRLTHLNREGVNSFGIKATVQVSL
ncbi:MAG: carboxypeptidase-like regulatory domain-containing protein [Cytophagales bacterium]|nr:carboxypeptidase-like regulatory domain-containing protein [Cytophagales bacterium]